MFNAFDPFAMLAGRVGQAPPAAMMVPAAAPPTIMQRPPWGFPGGGAPVTPTPYGPWPGGCSPPSSCYPLDYCPPQSMPFYGQAMRSAIAAHTPQTALGVSSRDLAPGTVIVAGTSRVLSVSPTVPYCITDLRISRTSAPFFGILSLKAARIEYLTDGVQVPADDFAPDSEKPPLQMPMLFPGTNVSLTVRNNDTADHHFDGAYYGIPGPSCAPCI